MSFILKAPFPAVITTTLLPSPKWGDSKAITSTVTSMRSINGTLYTYVKSRNGRKKFNWEFELSRHKALELLYFLRSYHGKLIQIVDHDGDTFHGYMKNNPFEFAGAGRAGENWPGKETMTVILEFEEK